MAGSSSERYEMNSLDGFGMHYGNCHAMQEAQTHKTTLSVAEPIIFIREGGAGEYRGCIDKIKAVILEIDAPLPFIPCVAHRQSVYTSCAGVKAGESTGSQVLSQQILSQG